MTWYNLLSNQFTGLNGIVVPGTLRASLVRNREPIIYKINHHTRPG